MSRNGRWKGWDGNRLYLGGMHKYGILTQLSILCLSAHSSAVTFFLRKIDRNPEDGIIKMENTLVDSGCINHNAQRPEPSAHVLGFQMQNIRMKFSNKTKRICLTSAC